MSQVYITLNQTDDSTGQVNEHHEIMTLEIGARLQISDDSSVIRLVVTVNSYKDKTTFDLGGKTPSVSQVIYSDPTAGIDFDDTTVLLNETTIAEKIAVDWGGVSGDVTVV